MSHFHVYAAQINPVRTLGQIFKESEGCPQALQSPRRSIYIHTTGTHTPHKNLPAYCLLLPFPSHLETRAWSSNPRPAVVVPLHLPPRRGLEPWGGLRGKAAAHSAGSGSRGKDPRKVQGGVFQATSLALDAPPLFLSRSGGLFDLRCFFFGRQTKSAVKARGSEPRGQPLLPPPLARTRGVSRPWPTPDCRGQDGGCLPNSARAPNTSCCCAHTQACTNTHTNPLPAPPNTYNIHEHPDAHRQPGKEASRRRSR